MKTDAKTAIFNEDGLILLLRRSLSDTARPGEWDFPGGGIEPGEEITVGASREILEEAGLTVSAPELKLVYAGTAVAEEYNISQNRLLFVAKIKNPEVRLSDEHTEYVWLTVEDALKEWPHPFWSVGLRYALDHNLLLK